MARRITEINPKTGGVKGTLGTTYTRGELREMSKAPGARIKGSVLRRAGSERVGKKLGMKGSDVRAAMKGKAGEGGVTVLGGKRGGRSAVRGRRG